MYMFDFPLSLTKMEFKMRTQISTTRPVREVNNVKVSVTMPADMVAALKVAGFQRRSLGEDNFGMACLVREAVEEWLDREIHKSSLVSVQIQ